jgi:nitrite reductase (NADH) large subunit
MTRYVIVGGGVAGATAAQNLRRLDPSAGVTLLGDESHPYYFRPRLWEFLAGRVEHSELYYRPAEWYAAQKINLRLNAAAVGIHPRDHILTLASGETVSYDRLLLATGASSFLPDIPGAALPGVFVLRTLQDAAALRETAAHGRRAVVVGGGLLGLESANALSALGLEVTVVEIAPYLLPKQLDREGAEFLRARLEATGLRFLTGARTVEVTGGAEANGIRLEDGRIVPGEKILFSAGVVPRTELARIAGLETKKGILVDRSLQTSAEDVFAAGDAAECEGRTYGLIPPAVEQARAASQNMAGLEITDYRGTLPAATLKLMGMDLTSLGEATAEGPELTILRKADEKGGTYKKLILRGGVVIGAILLNDMAGVPLFKRLIASRKDVSAVQEKLLDPAFELKAFVSETPVDTRTGPTEGGPE